MKFPINYTLPEGGYNIATFFGKGLIHAHDKAENQNKANSVRTRHFVHIGFSLLMFLVIIIFNSLNDKSVVTMIFKVASYTYGPLLGLYAFGLFMKSKTVHDKLVPIICVISPLICFLLAKNSAALS
jgi:hypothetical protein